MSHDDLMSFLQLMHLQALFETIGWRITDADFIVTVKLTDDFCASEIVIRIDILKAESIGDDVGEFQEGEECYLESTITFSDWGNTTVEEYDLSKYSEVGYLDKIVEIKDFITEVEILEGGGFNYNTAFDIAVEGKTELDYTEQDIVSYWRDENGRLEYKVDGVISG